MPSPFSFYATSSGNPINFYGRDDANLPILKLLCEGSDGQTTTIDSSVSNLTVTVNGGVALDTDQFASGVSSAYFPSDGGTGTGGGVNYFSFAPGTIWDWSRSDFVWEFDIRYEAANNGFTIFFSWFQNAFSYLRFYYIADHPTIVNPKGILALEHSGGPAGYTMITSNTFTPALHEWKHISLIRVGSVFSFERDGLGIGGTVNTGPLHYLPNTALQIGTDLQGNPNRALQGWLDNITMSRTVPIPIKIYGV